jgi:hypothetical protein
MNFIRLSYLLLLWNYGMKSRHIRLPHKQILKFELVEILATK